VGQGLLIAEATRSHSDTLHPVNLLWKSDQPDAETSLTTRNSQNRHTSITPAGFEPAIPASERPHTHSLGRAATGIGLSPPYKKKLIIFFMQPIGLLIPINFHIPSNNRAIPFLLGKNFYIPDPSSRAKKSEKNLLGLLNSRRWDGYVVCSETSVMIHHSTLRKIPEKHRSDFHGVGSLKPPN